VHDYFDILGVSDTTTPREIRLACARRARHVHPDFSGASQRSQPGEAAAWPRADVAIDFVDMAVFVSRVQAAFLDDPTAGR
jgi:hypothetical protein